MADKAHRKTDKLLAELEEKLEMIYKQAGEDVEAKAAEYFKKFATADAKKAALVAEGKLDRDEYIRWRKNKLLYGEHWKRLRSDLALEYLRANETALSYVNGKIPEVYAINRNFAAVDISEQVSEMGGNYAFELVDAQTVKNLAMSDETLLPYKYVDGVRDVRWNTQKVNSAVLGGILAGDSVPKLARRLRTVTGMNRTSAIRNARTTVTSAENKGRQDSYEQAEADGIKLRREWIAAIDSRTRHAHRLLDGQLADTDKPFKSELGNIMYPGDPKADPANVYNCRCTVAATVVSIDGVDVDDEGYGEREYADRRTAQDFYNEDPEKIDKLQKMLYNESADKKLLRKHKSEFGGNASRSLSELRQMKYNTPAEWSQYKAYLRSIRSGELTPLADFELYKRFSRQIDEKLIGITTVNGIKIISKSDHFIARVIGSVEQKRDGVDIDDVFKALTERNTRIFSIIKGSNGKTSQKFRYGNVEVSVNPLTGNLIQTNPYKRGGNNDKNNKRG